MRIERFAKPRALNSGRLCRATRAAGELFQANFVISGNEVKDVNARVKAIIYDGAIGVEVLQRFVVTIDFANERIWMKPI